MAPRKKKQESESKSPKAKPRLRVLLSDSLIVAVQKLAYGNASAGAILSRTVMKMIHNDAIQFLNKLSELEFYGSDIESAYAACNRDSDWLVAAVLVSDPSLLREVERAKVEKVAKAMKLAQEYL